MVQISRNKRSLLALALVLLTASVTPSQQTQNNQSPNRSLEMLVLGDSILWGQGLKAEHKSWHMVKLWLEKNTGRRVVERIEAHQVR